MVSTQIKSLLELGAPSILTLLIKDIYNYVKRDLKNNIDEDRFFDNLYSRFEDYHRATCERLSHFRTYYSKNFTVDFEDAYYPLSIRGYKNDDIIEINKVIKDLFISNKRITLIGSAGSGKTMITKRIFLSSLESMNLIPYIVELRKLNQNQTIYDYIKDSLFAFEPNSFDEKTYNDILKSGKFLFIFDGYDELQYDSPKMKNEVFDWRTKDIDTFTKSFNDNSYIVTSREGINADYLESFDAYRICDLSEKDIKPFILLLLKNEREGEELADNIYTKIKEKNIRDSYWDYFRNPLLLTLFVSTYRNYPELPKYKWEFYENVFNTLWSEHDSRSKPGGYQHHKFYSKKSYEKILQNFSYITYFKQLYQFKENELIKYLDQATKSLISNIDTILVKEDLVTSISILFRDGNVYTFPHRSMQEYFLALFISKTTPKNKINIYNYMRKDFSSHTNLLSLLSEIDDYGFCKYFLLIFLNSYIRKIEKYITSIENKKKNKVKILDILKETYTYNILLNNIKANYNLNEGIINPFDNIDFSEDQYFISSNNSLPKTPKSLLKYTESISKTTESLMKLTESISKSTNKTDKSINGLKDIDLSERTMFLKIYLSSLYINNAWEKKYYSYLKFTKDIENIDLKETMIVDSISTKLLKKIKQFLLHFKSKASDYLSLKEKEISSDFLQLPIIENDEKD